MCKRTSLVTGGKHLSKTFPISYMLNSKNRVFKVSKGAMIVNRYNRVPQLTQDTNGKVPKSQLDTTNESQVVRPFEAGDHRVQISRRAQRHNKHNTEKKHQ